MFLQEDSHQFCFQVLTDAQLHFRFQKQCESVGLVLIQTNNTGFFLPAIAVSGEKEDLNYLGNYNLLQ